jgi:hypothetical protein
MRRIAVIAGLGILISCLLTWTAAAGNQGKGQGQGRGKGKTGGAAVEHRSERAGERSNAQWSEGATRGQDRADEVRSENSKDKKNKRAKKDKKAKRDRGSEQDKQRKKDGSGRDAGEAEAEPEEMDAGEE